MARERRASVSSTEVTQTAMAGAGQSEIPTSFPPAGTTMTGASAGRTAGVTGAKARLRFARKTTDASILVLPSSVTLMGVATPMVVAPARCSGIPNARSPVTKASAAASVSLMVSESPPTELMTRPPDRTIQISSYPPRRRSEAICSRRIRPAIAGEMLVESLP
jgi:hypothetical protein